ncbi:MAG: M23 family metallopeptidase [Spirochaetota bacterium]|nr:M23 family metallopeptidase [Spirochaetota bacterium]
MQKKKTIIYYLILSSVLSLLLFMQEIVYPIEKAKIPPTKDLSNKISKIIKKEEKNTSSLKGSNWPKKNLISSFLPVHLSVSNSKPNQGDTIIIYISSTAKILKCFANMGNRKIKFLNINNNTFRSFLGFDIQHPPGKTKILIAVLFENNKVKYLSKEIKVIKKVITRRIKVYVKKKKWITKFYTKKGKKYKKRVLITYKIRKYIKPPKLNQSEKNNKTLNQFREELRDKILDIYQYGIGGVNEDRDFDDKSVINKSEKDAKSNGKTLTEKEFFNCKYMINLPIQFWQGPFLQPTYPDYKGKVSRYGAYRVFRYKGGIRRGYHRGLDIAKAAGTPLYAANHGIVVMSGKYKFRGNAVVIDHGGGIYSVHFHLSKIKVKKGMFVRKGKLIGYVGNTGISTGPHLHWEMRVDGTSVNPLSWKSLQLIK